MVLSRAQATYSTGLCVLFMVLSRAQATYSAGLGEQSGDQKDSMLKVYLGYRNIDEIFKLLKKKKSDSTLLKRRPGAVEGLGKLRCAAH